MRERSGKTAQSGGKQTNTQFVDGLAMSSGKPPGSGANTTLDMTSPNTSLNRCVAADTATAEFAPAHSQPAEQDRSGALIQNTYRSHSNTGS